MKDYILKKQKIYEKAFNRKTDILVLSEDHFNQIKDETEFLNYEFVIEQVTNPIIFTKNPLN